MEAIVRQFTRMQTIWALGLNAEQTETVRDMAGRSYALECWPAGELPDFSDPAAITVPCLICFTLESCRQFMTLPITLTGFLELAPKILLLEENAGMEAMEEALDLGVTDIIRHPVTGKRLMACLRRASEAAALQHDIQNMAHEIFIEREILERKNEALSFLVNFLTRVSESFDEAEMLSKTFTCLQTLLPVMTMHAVIFSKDDTGTRMANMFVAAPADTPSHEEWCARLLEIDGGAVEEITPTTVFLPLSGKADVAARPADGHILMLPVAIGDAARMYLLLLTSMERNLSRDQALALDSALSHMALCIKNLRRYQQVCHVADRDSLTNAYNRRFFEQVLQAEVARHARYGEELSLLILDLDHFKNVNDTWGHPKGDEVLRATVNVISSTIRQTDYCVRYGGEEFVVLLPHTTSRNAAWLAERLRRKIQKLSFNAGSEEFTITASLGVASIAADETKDGPTLTNEADIALYQAKHEGRNRVVLYASSVLERSPASM